MPVPFLIAGRIQNVQTCLFGVFAVQNRQPLEQQVRIINHLAGAAGHDAGGIFGDLLFSHNAHS